MLDGRNNRLFLHKNTSAKVLKSDEVLYSIVTVCHTVQHGCSHVSVQKLYTNFNPLLVETSERGHFIIL